MSRYTAVIFDLWGTLIDWPSNDASAALSRMAQAVGADPSHFAKAWAAACAARWTGDLELSLRSVCRSLGLHPTQETVIAAITHRIQFHRSLFTPRPDALATVSALRESGHKLGLISDCSSEVPTLWASSQFAPVFDAAVFSCLVGVRKPDPRIYRIACERLMVEPRRCLYIGDGASDELAGATAVGMTAVQLRTDPAPPWHGQVIASLSDVPSTCFAR